jgi:uncharacterized lipoprotein YddW (UPF0748 family)
MFKIIDPRKRLLIVAIILIISVVLIGCSSPVVSTEKSVEVLPTNNNLRTAQPVNQATGQAREIESPVRDLSKNSSTPMNGQTPTAEAVPGISPAATPVGQSINSDDGLSRETRAIWSWAGFQATSKEEVDQMVAKVVDRAHLNVILLLVYGEGTAHFEPSHSRFPNSEERLTNQSAFSEDGYHDVLSYLIAIRDERRADDDPTNDFEVQAWFIVNSGGRMEEAWPPIDKTEPYMLNAIFPEFKLKVGAAYQENDDRYAKHDTTVVQEPRFRAYMTDLIAGLVEDYDVDGVHLDYIRTGGICFNNEPLDYPGVEYDYPGCQEDYKAWTRETYGQEYTLWEDTDGGGLEPDHSRRET